MSENSKIEWCDHTINPWIGCTRVGPGCDNCYAATQDAFRKWTPEGWGGPRQRTSASNWALPIRWNAQAEAFAAQHGRRQRVFCASLADVFDNAVPDEWRLDLGALILATPNLDWLLLTKRIGNAAAMLAAMFPGGVPPNVRIGATIVNQAEADRDIIKLLQLGLPNFLSMEPLLESVDVSKYLWPVCGWWKGPYSSYGEAKAADAECGLKRQALVSARARFVDWVIVGGESGPGARPMHPGWVRVLRDQCQAAGTPFLFKQWGEWTPGENVERVRGTIDSAKLWDGTWDIQPLNLATDHGHVDDQPDLYRVGKKAAGRHLDGVVHNGFPEGCNA